MFQKLILGIFFIFLVFTGKATHIVGGEIYYDYLGNDQYRITMKIYRDCSSNNTNGTQFDDPAPIAIYQNGLLLNTLSVPIQSIINVPVVINDPCLQAPANICVEQATYVTNVFLNPSAAGYDLVYQRCCRNPSIINIVNSFDYGASYYVHVPGSGLAIGNSSPRFNTLPPLVICNGSSFVFDHSATDPDGDSLVYEFYQPFDGGTPTAPLPNPPLPPPYSTIIWQAGNSTNNQINGSPAFTINPNTGLMTGMPTTNGLHVYGITVKEYRNGVLISQAYRDFQTTVQNCPSIVVSSIPDQIDFCQGNTVSFDNNSLNAITYHWDFGDPNITNDTSNIVAPSYTYADTGTYQITLIANPGYTCADTAYSIYTVHLPLDPHFPTPAAQCITNNSFAFDVNGNFTSNAVIAWNFSSFALPTTSNLKNNPSIVFSSDGYFPVSVTVEEFGCEASYTDTAVVFPLPIIGCVLPDPNQCAPFLGIFLDTSSSWEPIHYIWTFGDGDFSNDPNTLHFYSGPGTYDITFTITVDSVCSYTTSLNFPDYLTINPSPVADIVATPLEQSAYTPLFTFYDHSSGHTTQTIYFDDGIDTTDMNEVSHTYFNSGWHNTILIAENEFGCTDSDTVLVYVTPETTVFAPNTFTPNGDGMNDVFYVHVYDVSFYQLRIFDRWGNLFLETNDVNQGWDGTRKGKKCPQDTYVFQVTYDDMQLIRHQITGHVNLVR